MTELPFATSLARILSTIGLRPEPDDHRRALAVLTSVRSQR